MTLRYGDAVKFKGELAKKIIPAAGVVSKKKSDHADCVWVEFAELPQLDNLRLVPIKMVEKTG